MTRLLSTISATKATFLPWSVVTRNSTCRSMLLARITVALNINRAICLRFMPPDKGEQSRSVFDRSIQPDFTPNVINY